MTSLVTVAHTCIPSTVLHFEISTFRMVHSTHATNIMLSKSSTTTSTAATTTTETEATIYCRHRSVCSRCDRPTPSACVCQALPLSSLVLSEVKHVWILQHPHEQTRKNRSLPLVQLCFDDDDDDHDFITVTIARRFPTLSASMPPQQQQPHNPRDDEARLPAPAIDIGRGTSLRIKDSSLSTEDTIASSSTGHRTDTAVVVPADAEPLTADQRSTMNLQSPLWMLSTNVWLLFPGEGSISLTEAIAGRRENQKDPVVLLVLDGTWKVGIGQPWIDFAVCSLSLVRTTSKQPTYQPTCQFSCLYCFVACTSNSTPKKWIEPTVTTTAIQAT